MAESSKGSVTSPKLSSDIEFKRAIESIKLRAPVEDVVRERIPDLRKAGSLWVACCPFHEEKTPSFKVDPRRGSWHCYGACAEGGDQISFVQKLDNLSFMDALEILAARTGVELPRSSSRRRDDGDDPGYAALAEADAFYQTQLHTAEGRRALQYLQERGLEENTLKAFGVGYAPANGRALSELAGKRRSIFEKAGLTRTNDSGRPYDFFRGRLIIPIRDAKGRTVGFGARRLSDGDEAGPKYINSAESPYFHKGRIIYGLDRAIDDVRRGGRMVLVEGYTDVMAAHQVGLPYVAAVLGTSTTEDHAGLVRRAGARRVSLVFDGDVAGQKAAFRALSGLLPLELELEVVSLPTGQDPCDLLIQGGNQPFLAALEHATSWFDFVVQGLNGMTGVDLAREVDRVFELVLRLPKPVHRESLIVQLAERLNLPVESLREQWNQLPERRRQKARREAQAEEPVVEVTPEPRAQPVAPRVQQAFRGLTGAVLLDSSLVPLVRPYAERCPVEGLRAIIACVLELYEDVDAVIDQQNVMTTLGEHPARELVVPCVEYALQAESPKSLMDGELAYLREREIEWERRRIAREIVDLERAVGEGQEDAESSLNEALGRLNELHKRGKSPQLS